MNLVSVLRLYTLGIVLNGPVQGLLLHLASLDRQLSKQIHTPGTLFTSLATSIYDLAVSLSLDPPEL